MNIPNLAVALYSTFTLATTNLNTQRIEGQHIEEVCVEENKILTLEQFTEKELVKAKAENVSKIDNEISKIDKEKLKTEINNSSTKEQVTQIVTNALTEQNKIIEQEKLAEEKRKAEEARRLEEKRKLEQTQTQSQPIQTATPKPPVGPTTNGTPYFGDNGLLVMTGSGRAQNVVNLLLSIPGHSHGAGYHAATGLDNYINELSTEEATWVIHRIEGAGFGQTAAGYAGIDSTLTHQKFIEQQVNLRFNGSIHALLRAWGTFSYSGY